MKICFNCKEEKELRQFYTHKGMAALGFLGDSVEITTNAASYLATNGVF